MRKASISKILLLCLVALQADAGCASAQEANDPEANFEYLWQTFDRNYGIFGPKRVDWDALYRVYRPQVTAETSDEQLFDIMASLLGHLNDNHVRLISPDRRFQSGILGEISGSREGFGRGELDDFSLQLIKDGYLNGRYRQRVRNVFTFGWLSDSIGYFHFRGFGSLDGSAAAVDEIVQGFASARGIIIDVRANGGGDDRVGKAIADRFADQKRLYMTTQVRDGPEHDDFSAPKYWYVEPEGPVQFTGPVIMLQHRFSISAAENFALAMRILPHVTLVGDMSSGVFADVYGDQLPNGWRFGVPYKLFLDQNGFCWEGIGVPADIRQTNRKEDIEAGVDRALELAMSLILSGELGPHGDMGSLRDVRESAVELIERELGHNGLDAATQAYSRVRTAEPEAFYLDEDDLLELGRRLAASGRLEAAAGILEIGVREFPKSYAVQETLGDVHFDLGDEERGRQSYARALEANRRSYPWEKQAYEAQREIAAGKRALSRLLGTAEDDAALSAVLEGFRRDRQAYHVNEGETNSYGYVLLREGRVSAAIEVFKINVEQFPESWNVYDSLGEAYMVQGDTALAIELYEKSIEINPNNTNGREMLARLRGQ
jgi:C-terminal processing protease CtpA/Prc/Tfp pilus assembly protein PilF